MPPIERDERRHLVTLFATAGKGRDGKNVFATPRQIRVRWSWGRTESVSAQGLPVALDATAIVNEEIPVGSVVWYGELDDYYGTGSADTGDREYYEVLNYREVPDLKKRNSHKTISLAYYRQGKPVITS